MNFTKMRPGEFRLFFPSLSPEQQAESHYFNFRDALDRLSEAFSALGGPDLASLETEPMIYVVGRPHWGAKYRGVDRKLELKYRTEMVAIGDCPYAIEHYKKKKYGKYSVKQMRMKLLEKLKKFCGDQQTVEEVELAGQAFDNERLIALNKLRQSYYHGDLSIEYAHLTIDEANSTFREALSIDGSPFRDSPARRASQRVVTYTPHEDFEKQLTAIYTLYNQDKLPFVGQIASQFEGREALLLSELHLKYDMEDHHLELFEGLTVGAHLDSIISPEIQSLAGIERSTTDGAKARTESAPATPTAATAGKAGRPSDGRGGVEWVSVAFEGSEEQINGFVQSSDFALLAAVLEEGLRIGVPVLVGGYPTFVSLAGNGLEVGDDCDNEAHEAYNSSVLGPTQAILRFYQQKQGASADRGGGGGEGGGGGGSFFK